MGYYDKVWLNKDKKIIKPVVPLGSEEMKKEPKKTIKPIELNKDRQKIIDYIINTSNSQNNSSQEEQNEVEESKKIKPLHPIKPKKDIKPIEIKK